jgi:hypothetical protein
MSWRIRAAVAKSFWKSVKAREGSFTLQLLANRVSVFSKPIISSILSSTLLLSEGEVERNYVLSELSRVGSIYPKPSQSTS